MTISNQSIATETEPGQLTRSCLICDGQRHRPVFSEFGVEILRCGSCGHVFSSFAGDAHYDGFWGENVPDSDHFYWSQARTRMHQDFFKRFLAGRSGRLLDMGCGLGFFLKAMGAYPSWQPYGCEISPSAVRYIREKLCLNNVICSRLQDCDFPQGSFDIVTMWDVLDHLLSPDPALRRCRALLKDGGMLFIRTPNISVQLPRARLKKLTQNTHGEHSYLRAQEHFHHYSRSSIRTLLERNGFSHIELTHLHPIVSSRSVVGRAIKNACYEAVRATAILSRDRLNLDNLFVVAR